MGWKPALHAIREKMDFNLHRLENIRVEPPRKDILARLKFNVHKTKLDRRSLDLFEKTLDLASSICECKGVYRFLEIKENSPELILLSDGTSFKSASLAKLLKNSSRIVLMATTAGREITEETNRLIALNRASEAVIVDAAGSEIADEAMNQVNLICANIAKSAGMRLSRMRFSPGYGDLGIANQKQISESLGLDKIGISMTESHMLIPEKSVTAIAGVE